ncbi:TraR/DksA C4-type zinc finger protein [Methylobacterium sp. J-077]|uniref:TraR/DksA C4-type zinc finger protein n=1 Tax=Methylobacterium sp. J-077 TaxID=2836656 RepID=UPI001FB8ACFE|nr:TraR/DksA C4-type zinc finger protein [Methylobacterium sp. J-077]MCJ2123395.1 TraR/DksA C4-type zinc finger protein [Methylobacterium sp. J-077]
MIVSLVQTAWVPGIAIRDTELVFTRAMPNERSIPPARTICRSCGETIRAGTTYCVACATRQADSDAAVFDRWLAILFSGAGIVVLVLAAYIAARYLNLLA